MKVASKSMATVWSEASAVAASNKEANGAPQLRGKPLEKNSDSWSEY